MIVEGRIPQSRAAAVYDFAADSFEAAALSCWDRFSRRTVDRLRLPRGAHVLDVCCGSGGSAVRAAEAVGPTGSVLGIDLAEGLVARARARAARENLANVAFGVGDVATLDGEMGSLDAIICVFGIFFIPDMVDAVARLWKLVRPGGVLAITTWGPRLFEPASGAFWDAVRCEAPAFHKAFNPWDRLADPSDVRALFGKAGIATVEVEAEAGTQVLEAPEDWWTIVLGSGYRWTLEQLDDATRERVRTRTLTRLANDRVGSIEANVIYATARCR
jgi:ubiquinone/menaquinone biosynthesis C-methylase UbiE